jgi:hypothetical protein
MTELARTIDVNDVALEKGVLARNNSISTRRSFSPPALVN